MFIPHLRGALILSSLLALTACGGGGSGSAANGTSASTSTGAASGTGGSAGAPVNGDGTPVGTNPDGSPAAPIPLATLPQNVTNPTPAQASRFLAQASYGATVPAIDDVVASGESAWINKQFSLPQVKHVDYMQAVQATLGPGTRTGQMEFFASYWKQAATGPDQLRQRMAFALSQIFVVSMQDNGVGEHPMLAASFYDMLGANAFGNYRALLEAVALHPAMGVYLTSMHNQKENGVRTPDENFGREVMQLMSIGLYELNSDGSQKLVNNQPVETYSSDDIRGMAKVFTGWSWGGPDKSDARFYGWAKDGAVGETLPMQSYPAYHSTSEKQFLGVTVPAQSTPNPEASLKIALDRLFNHPNVGPFIGRQLIQRLVTSNPSPGYIARVSAAFADNGQGVRGDMKAFIRAILLDPEARDDARITAIDNGKLREPILRLSAWMRAFNATSASGRYSLYEFDDALYGLNQSPLRSPSVFNFYRPGYVPPNTTIAAANLVAPEMQLVGDTSVVGYLDTMHDIVAYGTGLNRDVKSNYEAEIALAGTPEKLIDRINLLLFANQMSPTLRAQMLTAVNSVTISSTDQARADEARKNRAMLAAYLALASTEFLVQK